MTVATDDHLFETIIGHDGRPARILRDGARFTVGMMARDAATGDDRAARDAAGRHGVLHGGDFCRPGFVVAADAAARDRGEIARREYIDGLVNAWRRPSKEAKPSQPGGDGRCDPEIDDVRRPVLDAAEAERIRAEARDAYITYVTNAWRR
jgi:hypothetical protein